MSGTEATFVISLILGMISIIEATKTVYNTAKDTKGQLKAFHKVAAQLPLVIDTLHLVKVRATTLNEMALEILEPILESSRAKAENLEKIF
ncbi:hypothetical protein V8E51_004171 [Hyaloscypha variabilis]